MIRLAPTSPSQPNATVRARVLMERRATHTTNNARGMPTGVMNDKFASARHMPMGQLEPSVIAVSEPAWRRGYVPSANRCLVDPFEAILGHQLHQFGTALADVLLSGGIEIVREQHEFADDAAGSGGVVISSR